MTLPPVRIECRSCLGDGFTTFGIKRIAKVQCAVCEGRKTVWIDPSELKAGDVVRRR